MGCGASKDALHAPLLDANGAPMTSGGAAADKTVADNDANTTTATTTSAAAAAAAAATTDASSTPVAITLQQSSTAAPGASVTATANAIASTAPTTPALNALDPDVHKLTASQGHSHAHAGSGAIDAVSVAGVSHAAVSSRDGGMPVSAHGIGDMVLSSAPSSAGMSSIAQNDAAAAASAAGLSSVHDLQAASVAAATAPASASSSSSAAALHSAPSNAGAGAGAGHGEPSAAASSSSSAATAATSPPNGPAASASAPPLVAASASASAAAGAGSKLTVPIIHKRTQSTDEKYQILKVLGEGASCKVVAVRDRKTNNYYAMKIMDKSEAYNKVLYENETKILSTLRHTNILELVEGYEDKRTYHILTVLCQGGELFDRVTKGSFSESAAAALTRQMLAAIDYCHRHNIVHRDLKPENFVFDNDKENSNMKLIDFGCAKFVKDDEPIADVAGSPYYCAPEVLSESIVRTGKIWKAADMWSIGVIIFLLVCGYPPFNGDSQDKIFKKIKKGVYRFPKSVDSGGVDLSPSVRNLISALLTMNPNQRLTAAQALQHPWVAGVEAPDRPLPSSVLSALSSFRSMCRLKKAAARVLQNRMTEEDRSRLELVFKQYDQNGDGQLGVEEVARMMKHIGKNETEAKTMMQFMDEDGSGGVSLSEFETVAALGQLSKEEEIKRSFDMFDLDHDGFITNKELERVCDFLTPEGVDELIREVDDNNDGKITFDEWLKAMMGISPDALLQKQFTNKKKSEMPKIREDGERLSARSGEASARTSHRENGTDAGAKHAQEQKESAGENAGSAGGAGGAASDAAAANGGSAAAPVAADASQASS